MTTFTLAAYVTNGQSYETAETCLAIASQSASGEWYTDEGLLIYPYWTTTLSLTVPPMPPGWPEHLHTLAIAYAAAHPS